MVQRKLTNTLFIILVTVFLCGLAGLQLTNKTGIQLPESSGIGRSQSVLEGRSYTTRPTPSLDSIVSGAFQLQCEKYLADLTPMRETVVLCNASMQRAIIEAANVPFSWNCYPTFFESTICFDPQSNRLVHIAEKISDNDMAAIKTFAHELCQFAREQPNRRFIIYIGDILDHSPANPTRKLVSETTCITDVLEAFGELRNVPNAFVLSNVYYSLDEYNKVFYLNDHHWNSLGALTAYNSISEQISLKPISGDTRTLNGFEMTGSYSRRGLKFIETCPFDLTFNFKSLLIETMQGQIIDGNYHEDLYDIDPLFGSMYFYDVYYNGYGTQSASRCIHNPNESGTAVLISDSYGGAIKRMIAMNYANLYTNLSLEMRTNNLETIRQNVLECDASDVYIIGIAKNFITS